MSGERQQFLALGGDCSLTHNRQMAQVERVLDQFDFVRVKTAMEALGWRYTGAESTPDLRILRATAHRLLESAANEREDGVEFQSGGFRASWHSGNTLFLRFEVASAYSSLAD